MTLRSKVKRNILTFHSEDEEDAVIFQREHQWKDGEEMVQVNVARFVTEKENFFAVDKAGFEEIRETALAFECFVVHEYENSKTLERKETSNSSSEDEVQQESVVDPVVNVRQRRTKGNRYHLVIANRFLE